MFLRKQRSGEEKRALATPFHPERDHFWGSTYAPLEVVTYSDFQCMHCGDLYLSIKILRRDFGGALKFVFRHYPLAAHYPLSLDAAVACESAARHGLFWEMHDRIFENQRYLVRCSFSRFAQEIGLNDNSSVNVIGYKKLLQPVLQNYITGLKSGVTATPTLFLNGRMYTGLLDIESLRMAFQSSLEQKREK